MTGQLADEQANPQKALAALEESRRELESLTYTIAHDLRAPLRTIDGFARALSEDCGEELDQDGRRYLQHVLDAAKRMSGMLEGLLSLARIHGAEFHRVSLDLSKIARDVVEQLRAAEPARTVEVVIPHAIATTGDPSLLANALEALLKNAWKFTRGRDPGRIEVGVQSADPPIYVVHDNGVGFDMSYVGKLFGPFQRLHSEREFEGSGIGLAAAHRVIRRHGGRIWAEAAPDRGASFYFTLEAGPEA
ncbi:MAG TPA: ATP-binding protein [Steroidobacteraceae bacterium]|jgi:light-regulated signal transduction histidine kinase (bacteriophytochrome)